MCVYGLAQVRIFVMGIAHTHMQVLKIARPCAFATGKLNYVRVEEYKYTAKIRRSTRTREQKKVPQLRQLIVNGAETWENVLDIDFFLGVWHQNRMIFANHSDFWGKELFSFICLQILLPNTAWTPRPFIMFFALQGSYLKPFRRWDADFVLSLDR